MGFTKRTRPKRASINPPVIVKEVMVVEPGTGMVGVTVGGIVGVQVGPKVGLGVKVGAGVAVGVAVGATVGVQVGSNSSAPTMGTKKLSNRKIKRQRITRVFFILNLA